MVYGSEARVMKTQQFGGSEVSTTRWWVSYQVKHLVRRSHQNDTLWDEYVPDQETSCDLSQIEKSIKSSPKYSKSDQMVTWSWIMDATQYTSWSHLCTQVCDRERERERDGECVCVSDRTPRRGGADNVIHSGHSNVQSQYSGGGENFCLRFLWCVQSEITHPLHTIAHASATSLHSIRICVSAHSCTVDEWLPTAQSQKSETKNYGVRAKSILVCTHKWKKQDPKIYFLLSKVRID